jgi:hypothetical protein
MARNSPRANRPAALAHAPKATPTKAPSQKDTPIFCFRFVDRKTNRPWKFKPTKNEATKILEQMADIGNTVWSEIEKIKGPTGQPRHHSHPVAKFDPKAQRDLANAELDDIIGDEMFRFRLGSTRRLWGFRRDRTFHVVWWDPQHKVYPTEPKNT